MLTRVPVHVDGDAISVRDRVKINKLKQILGSRAAAVECGRLSLNGGRTQSVLKKCREKKTRAALTKSRAAGRMKRPHYQCDSAVPGAHFLTLVPEWRNWQTRCVQVAVIARSWRFESSLGHQFSGKSGFFDRNVNFPLHFYRSRSSFL